MQNIQKRTIHSEAKNQFPRNSKGRVPDLYFIFLQQIICNISVYTLAKSLKFFVELLYSLHNTLVSMFLDSGYPVFWNPAKTCNFSNFCQIEAAHSHSQRAFSWIALHKKIEVSTYTTF